MHLSRIEFDGFRNLTDTVAMSHPLAVLVGANNTGKSNVVDALRMTLLPLAGWPLRPTRSDFAHEGTGDPTMSEMTITAGFEGLSLQQSGRMITALDGALDRATLHLRCTLPDVGAPKRRLLGGDAKTPDIEEWARSAVTYTYLPPLRDAEEDMRPGRNNRVIDLIAALVADGGDRQQVLDIAKSTNDGLSAVSSIATARTRIQERLDAIAGAGHAQQAELLFSEPIFERVLSTLGVRVGDVLPLAMHENGLGLNNVLYMAVLLAGLTYEPESELHLLLVEEPEAHLHPQMQDLLMRFLQSQVDDREDVQVIVTTHSPNFASAARVERITSMSRRPSGIAARAIETFGLHADELDHLARFLDVTKASLLFARAVLLVEGVAEQLLMPVLATELSESLAESGVTVVNVGGLAFGPFAALFDDDRLPHRCAIVSDADPPKAKDKTPEELQAEQQRGDDGGQGGANGATEGEGGYGEDEQPDSILSATAQKLKDSENARRRVFLSTKTLEYDLVVAGNWEWALAALRLIKPRVTRRLEEDETLTTPEARAAAVLAAVEGVKGRFAQALTTTLPEVRAQGHQITVPDYIADAVRWTCAIGQPSVPGAGGAADAGSEGATATTAAATSQRAAHAESTEPEPPATEPHPPADPA